MRGKLVNWELGTGNWNCDIAQFHPPKLWFFVLFFFCPGDMVWSQCFGQTFRRAKVLGKGESLLPGSMNSAMGMEMESRYVNSPCMQAGSCQISSVWLSNPAGRSRPRN